MYSHLNQFQFLNQYSWLFAEVNLKYSRCPCGQALLLPQRGPWDRLTRRTQGLPCIKCLQGELLEDEGFFIPSCSTQVLVGWQRACSKWTDNHVQEGGPGLILTTSEKQRERQSVFISNNSKKEMNWEKKAVSTNNVWVALKTSANLFYIIHKSPWEHALI